MLLKLAWRNLWRNKKRTFITMGSIVFAVLLSILMDSIKKGLLDKMKENIVGLYTGYIQVHKAGYWDDKVLDNSFQQNPLLEEQLLSNPSINSLIPRLESFCLAAASTYSKGCMVVGIDPVKEAKLNNLNEKIIEGKYLQESDPGVLLGEGLASYLHLTVGDTLVLLGQGYHGISAAGKYPITGLIKFGSPELNKGLVYLNLENCQQLFGAEDNITALVLSMEDVNKAEYVAKLLSTTIDQEYEVMGWKTMSPELDHFIQGESAENMIFQFILYLLIAFGIFGTILMMTLERQYEFGVMIAIGMKNGSLSLMVIIENILISVLGALSGIFISIPIVYYLYRFPIRLEGQLAEAYESFGMEPIFYFSMAPLVFYRQALIVLFLALILSFYPLLRISRLEPIKAMNV